MFDCVGIAERLLRVSLTFPYTSDDKVLWMKTTLQEAVFIHQVHRLSRRVFWILWGSLNICQRTVRKCSSRKWKESTEKQATSGWTALTSKTWFSSLRWRRRKSAKCFSILVFFRWCINIFHESSKLFVSYYDSWYNGNNQIKFNADFLKCNGQFNLLTKIPDSTETLLWTFGALIKI